jgi:hypothetical protein
MIVAVVDGLCAIDPGLPSREALSAVVTLTRSLGQSLVPGCRQQAIGAAGLAMPRLAIRKGIGDASDVREEPAKVGYVSRSG